MNPIPKNPPADFSKVDESSFVDKSHGQVTRTKKWATVAIVVGSLAAVVGLIAAASLAHAYGHLSLPHQLASAVNFVGNTPYHWSLWAIAGGGALGIIPLAIGSAKMHSARKVQGQLASIEEKFETVKKEDGEKYGKYGLTADKQYVKMIFDGKLTSMLLVRNNGEYKMLKYKNVDGPLVTNFLNYYNFEGTTEQIPQEK